MAVTYPTATKTARMTAVVTAIGTSGKLKLFTAADRYLAAHKAACSDARHEQNRVRRPVSTVSYGGI